MSLTFDTAPGGRAVFSSDRRHRFVLARTFESGDGKCCFVLLNPSHAGASETDPTTTRCINFARSWGFREMSLVNLFSLCERSPRRLLAAEKPLAAHNDDLLVEEVASANLVIVGWGNHGRHRGRDAQVIDLLHAHGLAPHSLGVNRSGTPRHPLYLPRSAMPIPHAPTLLGGRK